MMRVCVLVLFLLPLVAVAQRGETQHQSTIPEYITKYSEIAKAEMRRSGIPASITLAQGILESNYGNSNLARKANNHFGIKCGNNWKGPTYIQDDDTKNECFRKYESVLHSFADHSNFLRGKDRYASLFELNSKDYKGWANGLKAAGYATNPNYAMILIRLIEERDLHRFDTEEKITPLTVEEKQYYEEVSDKFYVFHGIKTVIAQPNQMLMDMAAQYDVSLSALLKYNDLHEGDYVKPGTKIFLEPKKSTGHQAFHRVDEGETMHSISQEEGIKLKALLKKNGMTYGQEAAEGEVLCLKKKCKTTPKLKTDEEIKHNIKQEIQSRVDEAVKDKQKQAAPVATRDIEKPVEKMNVEELPVPEKKPVVQERAPEVVEEPELEEPFVGGEKLPVTPARAEEVITPPVTAEKPAGTKTTKYHNVAPQETLFKIATAYGLTVDELKKLNGLTSNNISIGQRLIVSSPNAAVAEKAVSAPVVNSKPAPSVKNNEDASASIEERQPKYHIVGPQETMYKIATQYKISVAELKVMNDLTGNTLSVGQKLLVGYSGVVRTDPVDTPSRVQHEDEPAAQPKQTTSEGPSYHKVQQGETLYSVATKYKLSVDDLKALNKLPNNDIQPGRVLKLR